jgi:glycosyltransferase involved in cell wall biosynthesis
LQCKEKMTPFRVKLLQKSMVLQPVIDVIIPAWNEEECLPLVLRAIPRDLVRKIVVADNASTDQTTSVALANGAVVVSAPVRGYGSACLAAMQHIRQSADALPDVVVFLDGDYSDEPGQMPEIVAPIIAGQADFVIGSRLLGQMDKGAMTAPQRFGNWLAPALIQLFWGKRFTDLGPFRAIRWQTLEAMQMIDQNFGWTVEMQIKAAKMHIKSTEVPVRYHRRAAGQSKVSGTIKGAWNAGTIILFCVFKHLFTKDTNKIKF